MFQCDSITNQFDEKFEILIVEDSKLINTLLAKNLRENGYTCHQSFTLSEAKQTIKDTNISLIVLDLHLPDGEGDELIFELQELNKDAKIVIFTSDSDLSRRDELFRYGILDYIIKGKNANLIANEILNIIYNIQVNPNYTILIVDDSIVVRKMIKRVLAPSGYKILEAKSGLIAFETIESENIDLILLDMEMSDMNGLEVLKSIKKDESNLHIPIFIISSNLEIEIMRNAYKEGALDYFKKPFSPEELKLKIEQALKQKQNEKDLKCSIEVSDICRNFLDGFYANAVLYANSRIKWNNEKFKNLFGENTKNIIQTFENFEEETTTDIIIAMKNKQIYKTIADRENKKYLIKLFPLKEEEFLLSVELLDL